MNFEDAISIIESNYFQNCYTRFIKVKSDLLKFTDDIEVYDNLSLKDAYADWNWLYSRLDYKVDRHAFSPYWLPVSKNEYKLFIDLGNPNWPLYLMNGKVSWNWEMETLSMSLKILLVPLGDIDVYLNKENMYAKSEHWPSKPTYEYINFRLENNFEVGDLWQLRQHHEMCSIVPFPGGHSITDAFPGQLRFLPNRFVVSVVSLVANSFQSQIDFGQFMARITTIEELLIVMDAGLWSCLDYLHLRTKLGVDIMLISERSITLRGKALIDFASCTFYITPVDHDITRMISNFGDHYSH